MEQLERRRGVTDNIHMHEGALRRFYETMAKWSITNQVKRYSLKPVMNTGMVDSRKQRLYIDVLIKDPKLMDAWRNLEQCLGNKAKEEGLSANSMPEVKAR